MKNIVLIGMMGCGKTTVGQLLARELARPFVDCDSLIEAQAGTSISDIFATRGEAGFRALERQVVAQVSAQAGLVIATGGGAVLDPDNVSNLRRNGILIFLDRPVADICRSLDTTGRPLAQDGEAAFAERHRQRLPYYTQAAHLTVREFSSPQATAGEITERLSYMEDLGNGPMLQVIGDPVLHSKSPILHSAMLSHLGLRIPYTPHVVKRGGLPAYLSWAKAHSVSGFNATMPHKEDLVPLMGQLGEDAAACGAVNTVCLRDGIWVGHNTDGAGCLAALRDRGLFPARKVVILGAGGAARAVALRLAREDVDTIWVCNRTPAKAEALCARDPQGILIPAGFDLSTLTRLCSQAQLVINCTNLGMEGCPHQFEDFSFLDALPQGAGVMDLIYHPAQTQLLQHAQRRGLATCNGLPMLVYQAILALEYFLDRPLPRKELAQVVFQALEA